MAEKTAATYALKKQLDAAGRLRDGKDAQQLKDAQSALDKAMKTVNDSMKNSGMRIGKRWRGRPAGRPKRGLRRKQRPRRPGWLWP